ncbi:DedA family protein [Magnetospirillum aberrantis]|uniref:DedA family protein n=1 Tax=Magnetospirillum aberrantis TaxID=1105283 RepID=UPI00197C2CDD|nr:DedA family protein [Magnetospirillum aberrantis]
MEEFILRLAAEYHYLTYPLVLVATFIEGETIVILMGAASSAGELPINVELLALAAFAGSFCGDQLYYLIGRRYGAPLLNRWPTLGHKIEWAFQLVKDHPTLFILSFRFIYGIRNIAPFVIGISGVPRLRYMVLNFIAAMVWAHSFAWGGYWLGKALEHWLGENKWYALLGFFALALLVGAIGYLKQKRKLRALEAKERAESDTSAASADVPSVSE